MVERRRRQAIATFFAADGLADAGPLALDEAAAHHARVRRLEIGDDVRVTNGRGTLASGRISRLSKNALEIDIADRTQSAPLDRLLLLVPVADRERMLWLAEKATELGVSAWQPVVYERSRSVSPRGEGPAFAEKVRARMRSALEQSGGAWLPEVLDEVDVSVAALAAAAGTRFLLDAAGVPMLSLRFANDLAIAVGPEGGITDDERTTFLEAGWVPVSLGATTLRFETAGLAAAAIARAAQRA